MQAVPGKVGVDGEILLLRAKEHGVYSHPRPLTDDEKLELSFSHCGDFSNMTAASSIASLLTAAINLAYTGNHHLGPVSYTHLTLPTIYSV